jgi:hypothetical protein
VLWTLVGSANFDALTAWAQSSNQIWKRSDNGDILYMMSPNKMNVCRAQRNDSERVGPKNRTCGRGTENAESP